MYETLEGIVAEAHHPDCKHIPSCYCPDLTAVLSSQVSYHDRDDTILLSSPDSMIFSSCERYHALSAGAEGLRWILCPADARFQNTGLERSAGLADDIAWMQQEYDLAPAQPSEDGPGKVYSRCVQPS